jgi:predicted nucleotide-binding protein (sugar kinase/HSP70/actin superfamily)
MTLRIGIPRALLYYRYFPLWNTFFKELGFEVIVSRPCHQGLIEEGFKYADDDNCIPIKMAFAHTLQLRDQVDFLFIPRLLSLDLKTCFCPRTAGLPEMLKYSIPHLPPILDPYIDERYRNTGLFRSLSEMASTLGKRLKEIRQAFGKAEKDFRSFSERVERGDRIRELFPNLGKENSSPQNEDLRKKIVLVSHPYCLYDPYFNFNLIKIIRKANVSIYTQEMVSREKIDHEIHQFGKNIYWTFGKEILGASLHYLHSSRVDGFIYLTCFSCGVDSMIEPLVRHKVKEDGRVLYLSLMIDEPTGASGVLTRMEAFLETVERRKANRGMG